MSATPNAESPTTGTCTCPVVDWKQVQDAILGYIDVAVKQYRIYVCAGLILWSYYPDAPFKALYAILYKAPRSVLCWILSCIGFTEDGVSRDSLASRYQSLEYRGYIPRDSLFASYQSIGARGASWPSENEEQGDATAFFSWVLFISALVLFFWDFD